MIYFVQAVEGGPIKIGYSESVDQRMRALESTYGKRMVLLSTMRGGRRKEREIHERFAHLRLGQTEQFRPAGDLMEFIGRPLLASPNPDAVLAMNKRRASFWRRVHLDTDVATDLRRIAQMERRDPDEITNEILRPLLKHRIRGYLKDMGP